MNNRAIFRYLNISLESYKNEASLVTSYLRISFRLTDSNIYDLKNIESSVSYLSSKESSISS